MDVGTSEGGAAPLLQVIFLSAGDGGPLQGHTISPLCLSFPSSLTHSVSTPPLPKLQFELVASVLPLASFFFFSLASDKIPNWTKVNDDHV